MFAHVVYHCGYQNAWSSLYSFTAMPAGSDWSPRFVLFGDMGNENAQSVGRLQEETQAGHFDAVLHVGMSNIVYWSGVVVAHWSRSTELTYVGPG